MVWQLQGKEKNKWMYKLLSNKGFSSRYKMMHKKKLLAVIFLQALDSWQSGQSQPHLIGSLCFFHSASRSLAHPAQERQTQAGHAPLLFPFEANPGMPDRGWVWQHCLSLMLQTDLVIPCIPLVSSPCLWNSKICKPSARELSHGAQLPRTSVGGCCG